MSTVTLTDGGVILGTVRSRSAVLCIQHMLVLGVFFVVVVFNNSVKDALRENTFLLIFTFYPIPQTNGHGLYLKDRE